MKVQSYFVRGSDFTEKKVGLLTETMKLLAADLRQTSGISPGDGPLAENLRSEAEKLGSTRSLLGHLDKETLSNYYANADVFVHPNPKEPFGIAPLEAMASGVPTLAPRSGGILSYADDDNAWLVEPKFDQFARAINEITSNESERLRRTENAIKTARSNTREISTDRLFATYDEMYKDFIIRKDLFVNAEGRERF